MGGIRQGGYFTLILGSDIMKDVLLFIEAWLIMMVLIAAVGLFVGWLGKGKKDNQKNENDNKSDLSE